MSTTQSLKQGQSILLTSQFPPIFVCCWFYLKRLWVLPCLSPSLYHSPSMWETLYQPCSNVLHFHVPRYLVSSLNHWNSAVGTAEASQLKMPFWPTETPVFLAFEIYGGSVGRECRVNPWNRWKPRSITCCANGFLRRPTFPVKHPLILGKEVLAARDGI